MGVPSFVVITRKLAKLWALKMGENGTIKVTTIATHKAKFLTFLIPSTIKFGENLRGSRLFLQ